MANTPKNDKPAENNKTPERSSPKSADTGTAPVARDIEKTLFTWKAASRPFQRRSREYWVTVISIAALLAFILFLAEGVMPVILISSLVFLYYILSTVNPEMVEYRITNWGIRIADTTTPWEALIQYWFTKRMGNDLLVIETTTFPFRLELVIDQKDIAKVKEIVNDYIPEGNKSLTYLDKTVDWVAKKLPSN